MRRGIAVLALSVLAGLVAGPLAAAGTAIAASLAGLLARPIPALGTASALALALAAAGGFGRPTLWMSLAALAALAAAATPVLDLLAPRRARPSAQDHASPAPRPKHAVPAQALPAVSLLALTTIGAALAVVGAAAHPTVGAAALAVSGAALIIGLGFSAEAGTRLHLRALAVALAAVLATGLPLVALTWPTLAPVGEPSTGPALVAAAQRRLATLPPEATATSGALLLTALARLLDVPPVWLLQPVTAALAALASLALVTFGDILWPSERHRAAGAVLLVLVLPWTSPLVLGLRGDVDALLLITAGLVTACCAAAVHAGRSRAPWVVAASAVASVALAPPLALAAAALGRIALPTPWAWWTGGSALAVGLASQALIGPRVAPAGLVALGGIAAATLVLGPGLAILTRRSQHALAVARAPALGAVVVLTIIGWLTSGMPNVGGPRPAELRLLEQVAAESIAGPIGYLGDGSSITWARALLAACACGAVQSLTWEAWDRGTAPGQALTPTLPAARRDAVLVLGWYDGSALVRRRPARYAAAQTVGPNTALFGDELLLHDWTLPRRVRPGDDLVVSFSAQALAGGQFTVRLALRSTEGTAVLETVRDLTLTPGERLAHRWQAILPYDAATGAYALSVEVTAAGVMLPAHTPSGQFSAGTVAVVRAEDVLAAEVPLPGTPAGAVFGDRIELVSYEVPRGPLPPGTGFPIVLYWRAVAALDEDLPVFVHLVGPDGRIVSQADGYPVAGRFPTGLWQRGEVVRDERRLHLPPDAAGVYELRVGWYRYDTGERLRLPASADDALRLATIEVAQ